MQTILYDGSFEEFLCAVFDVYEYKFQQVNIVQKNKYVKGLFETVHVVQYDASHCLRVSTGMKRKLSVQAIKNFHKTFLSEIDGIENVLLQFVQYVFISSKNIENDFSHPSVLAVAQTAKKVHREVHRMEAFVRFQKTADDLYYAVIDPDHNVLSLVAGHFKKRYADQQWLIYDTRRKYGIHYDLENINEVQIAFSQAAGEGNNIESLYDADEQMYQQLWQQYFKSVNIKARKNLKLQLQHMPKRYWKNMIETS